MLSRLVRTLAPFFSLLLMANMALAQTSPSGASTFSESVAALESANGGRLGVAVLDTSTGKRFGYRAEERFAMTSTFKWILVAAVLARADAGEESLERQVKYDQSDILSYAPIAKQHLAEGQMTVAELSDATVRYSDNTAANLLLETIGGPAGLTSYLRSIGDDVSRLDRFEPELNTNLPNDERDTTTPSAMLHTMQAVLVGNALTDESKQRLHDWLIRNTTGDAKLRAGLNPAWTVGDKTGAGERGASNDVAIIWPESGNPILVAVYYSGSSISPDARNAVHAEVGRLVTATLGDETR